MKTTSDRMVSAIALVHGGATGYRAARTAGITPQAIYKNPEYREIIKARRAAGVKVRQHYPRKHKQVLDA